MWKICKGLTIASSTTTGLSIAISGLGTLFNREPKIKQEPEQKLEEEK